MFKLDRNQSLGNRVKEEIMGMIIAGTIKPGDRLKEVDIAQQMGVSRLPVRDALLLLQQEGFIESGPYKNNIVIGLDYTEVLNVFLPIRRTIEVYALHKFLPLAEEKHFKFMEYQIRNMEWALESGHIVKFAEADIKFHECMLEASELTSLMSIWSSISNRLRMYFFASIQVLHDKLDRVVNDHVELLDCLRKKDMKLAEQKLIAHINDVVIQEKL